LQAASDLAVAARDNAPLASPIEQPVPFSHRHRVGDDGIDCRYCHASVETSSTARIPPLDTCMTGHRSASPTRWRSFAWRRPPGSCGSRSSAVSRSADLLPLGLG